VKIHSWQRFFYIPLHSFRSSVLTRRRRPYHPHSILLFSSIHFGSSGTFALSLFMTWTVLDFSSLFHEILLLRNSSGTVVVSDSGDFESIAAYKPQDATTNPSLM
jgi:hypothetical protein